MFEPTNLDEREATIWQNADEFWAMRFIGTGSYDRLGPYAAQVECLEQVRIFFATENGRYPPPSYVVNRPFLIYASSSAHSGAQVCLGNVYRDGVKRETHDEFRARKKEEEKSATRNRRSSNASRTTEV